MTSEEFDVRTEEDKRDIDVMIDELPFFFKEQIELLKALFTHGGHDLPTNMIPHMSTETFHSTLNQTLEILETFYKKKPSIAYWLRCGLFEKNYSIPLALLLIEMYEQNPLHSETGEYNFREIYHFLYELTINRPPTPISHNSAKILYTLLSDILNEPWSNMQHALVKFFSQMYQYNRSMNRRTYPGKKKMPLKRRRA